MTTTVVASLVLGLAYAALAATSQLRIVSPATPSDMDFGSSAQENDSALRLQPVNSEKAPATILTASAPSEPHRLIVPSYRTPPQSNELSTQTNEPPPQEDSTNPSFTFIDQSVATSVGRHVASPIQSLPPVENVSAAATSFNDPPAADDGLQEVPAIDLTQPVPEEIAVSPYPHDVIVGPNQPLFYAGANPPCDPYPCALGRGCYGLRLRDRWQYHTKPRLQCRYWGYAEYFCERPFGTYARALLQGQVGNGIAARMILHDYDFYGNGDPARLSERGIYQLAKIIELMHSNDFPLIIEASRKGPTLDNARRQEVVIQLQALDTGIAGSRVVVGRPFSPGLDGVEAELIHDNLIEQTRSGGGIGAGFSSDTSTSSSSGYSPTPTGLE